MSDQSKQVQPSPTFTHQETSVSAFEAIRHTDENGGEYWLARELAVLLGYGNKWQNFLSVIHEAMDVCRIQGGSAEKVFTAIGKNPSRQGGRPSPEYDYRLTRHACYIIAESADGRKPQVALAKIYFALTTERYELLAQTEEDRLRIEHRQRLLQENAELALQARAAGALTDQEFARFFNAGYRGLYHETQQEIRTRKGLKRGQDISDYMGSLETAANIFRAALARQLLADRDVSDMQTASATHHEAGDSVRALLVSKGIFPEALPTPAKSYQQLLREEEARQRILQEDQTGLWAKLLAGQVDDLIDEDDTPSD
ncbi:MAG: DNA damage-inducible protein D [Ktedonobacterales bacterium]